jgi:hypothetical protein
MKPSPQGCSERRSRGFSFSGLCTLLRAFRCSDYADSARKTKAALTAEINTNSPDNNVGTITPATLRSTVIDIVNSTVRVHRHVSLGHERRFYPWPATSGLKAAN